MIIDDLLKLYEEPVPIQVERADVRVAPLAHGWYIASRRLTVAIVQLTQTGFEFEAAPLRRTLIEHVLALRWLVRAGDEAVTSILGAHRFRIEKLQEAVADSEWPVAEERDAFDMILGVEPGTSSEDRNLHFKQRCSEVGSPDLYSAWLVETGSSHPTFTTVSAYLEHDGESEDTQLAWSPVGYPGGFLDAVAGLLLMASEDFNELIGKPWTADLERIRARLVPEAGVAGTQ